MKPPFNIVTILETFPTHCSLSSLIQTSTPSNISQKYQTCSLSMQFNSIYSILSNKHHSRSQNLPSPPLSYSTKHKFATYAIARQYSSLLIPGIIKRLLMESGGNPATNSGICLAMRCSLLNECCGNDHQFFEFISMSSEIQWFMSICT